MNVKCVFCGKQFPSNSPFVWRRRAGWEHRGTVVLREWLDEFACGGCVESRKLGSNPRQGGLL